MPKEKLPMEFYGHKAEGKLNSGDEALARFLTDTVKRCLDSGLAPMAGMTIIFGRETKRDNMPGIHLHVWSITPGLANEAALTIHDAMKDRNFERDPDGTMQPPDDLDKALDAFFVHKPDTARSMGPLAIAVTVEEGKLLIHFGKNKVQWMRFTKEKWVELRDRIDGVVKAGGIA